MIISKIVKNEEELGIKLCKSDINVDKYKDYDNLRSVEIVSKYVLLSGDEILTKEYDSLEEAEKQFDKLFIDSTYELLKKELEEIIEDLEIIYNDRNYILSNKDKSFYINLDIDYDYLKVNSGSCYINPFSLTSAKYLQQIGYNPKSEITLYIDDNNIIEKTMDKYSKRIEEIIFDIKDTETEDDEDNPDYIDSLGEEKFKDEFEENKLINLSNKYNISESEINGLCNGYIEYVGEDDISDGFDFEEWLENNVDWEDSIKDNESTIQPPFKKDRNIEEPTDEDEDDFDLGIKPIDKKSLEINFDNKTSKNKDLDYPQEQ